MYRSLRHPIETFRTSPIQFTGIAISLSVAAVNAQAALEVNNPPASAVEWGLASLNVGAFALNAVLAKGKLNLRDRLEPKLEKNGFNERIMNTTTQTYCTRQAARIACENTGYSEEYATLCKQNSENAAFTWLPQI